MGFLWWSWIRGTCLYEHTITLSAGALRVQTLFSMTDIPRSPRRNMQLSFISICRVRVSESTSVIKCMCRRKFSPNHCFALARSPPSEGSMISGWDATVEPTTPKKLLRKLPAATLIVAVRRLQLVFNIFNCLLRWPAGRRPGLGRARARRARFHPRLA